MSTSRGSGRQRESREPAEPLTVSAPKGLAV